MLELFLLNTCKKKIFPSTFQTVISELKSMASALGRLLQITFAGLSFVGPGYLFKAFHKDGYEAGLKKIWPDRNNYSMKMKLNNMIQFNN